MLYDVMKSCRNFFPIPGKAVTGTFEITDGKLAGLDFPSGQYILIEGSVFNDGVCLASADDLTDETFDGVITPLAVPKAFLQLVSRIEAWQEKYADTVSGPYTSESFGGYSYTKATGRSGGQVSWQDCFARELKEWRKV